MGEDASSLASGAVFGRYVLVERIGRGAMGEVWVAIDPDLDRKIALKLLRADRIARAQDRERIDAEVRLMARVTHPNVVTIHDLGIVDDQLFMAMEFVDGETLERWVARGPHPWQEVLAIMRQAAAGLVAAHGLGLVHRDFKPANVMIGREGRVRVLDFGLARPEGSVAGLDGETTARSATPETDDGGGKGLLGSPAYMSPEQHRGAHVDSRSDLFSFCVSLFEALYGVRPFHGNSRLAVAAAIVRGRVVELSADARARVPDWIHAIVMRGLASDPNQRFADMDELLAALERSPEQRRRRIIGIAATLVGVLGVVGVAMALRSEPAPDLCAGAGDVIAETWDADVGASLREQIDQQASARPLAGQRLVEGVDRHAAAWREASVQLCRDARARRLTERLQATREACLARQRASVGALQRLADANPEFVAGLAANPFAGVRALGDPSRCVDQAAPSDDARGLSEGLRTARIELELASAVLDGSQLPAELIAEVGSESGDDPELELLLARVALARGDRPDAEARFHAVAAATVGRVPQLAAEAWLALVELELRSLEDDDAPLDPRERATELDRVGQLLDYADALLPTHDHVARAKLGLLAARLTRLGSAEDRSALIDAAIERSTKGGGEPDLLIALLEHRAALHDRAGRTDAAVADRARAEKLTNDTFGAR